MKNPSCHCSDCSSFWFTVVITCAWREGSWGRRAGPVTEAEEKLKEVLSTGSEDHVHMWKQERYRWAVFCALKLDVTCSGRLDWEQSDTQTLSLSVFEHLMVKKRENGTWWQGVQVKISNGSTSSFSCSFWDPLQKLKLLNFHIQSLLYLLK